MFKAGNAISSLVDIDNYLSSLVQISSLQERESFKAFILDYIFFNSLT